MNTPLVEIVPEDERPPRLLREVLEFRRFLALLAWRDITVRYKQSVIGTLWALLQPAMMTVLLTVALGWFVRVPTHGVPYPLFYFSAMLSWHLFARAVNSAGTSLATNGPLISKVYFPRALVPLASVAADLVDFLAASLCLVPLLWWYGVAPPARAVLLPFFVLLNLVTILGLGLAFSVLDALYRDVRHFLPFFIQCLFFLSPLAYPSTLVPETYLPLYYLNPAATVLEGTRWCLLPYPPPAPSHVLVSAASACLLLLAGATVFLRLERTVVDRI